MALHYCAIKIREEYEEKMNMGNATDDPKTKGEELWVPMEIVLPRVDCPEMAKYDP